MGCDVSSFPVCVCVFICLCKISKNVCVWRSDPGAAGAEGPGVSGADGGGSAAGEGAPGDAAAGEGGGEERQRHPAAPETAEGG